MNRQNDIIETFALANTTVNDQISRNFYVSELIKSETAARHGIRNWFRTDLQLQSAIYLTRTILQPLRAAFGPFSPNSVYRSQAVERALKNKPTDWTSTSQHARGEAADIEIPIISNLELARFLEKRAAAREIDQLILEMYKSGQPCSGWVHVSCKLNGIGNRGQVKTFDGKTFKPGIVA